MNSAFRQAILLSLFLAFAAIAQFPGSAQNINDSFGSNTSDVGAISGTSDSLTYDIFSNDTPAGPGLTSGEINLHTDTFARSLPGDPKAIYGILDHLLRLRLEHWHYPNLSKLSVWMGDCHAALDKAAGINNKTEYQNSFHNRTAREISHTLEEKHQIDDCWNAWLKAYNAVLTLLPHNSGEEEEPRVSQSRADAQKAIELAESICHLHPLTAMPPPPQTSSNRQPPLAPQRPGTAPPTSQQPIVVRGRIVSNAHFERIKNIIGGLPPNIQQFMKNHHIKVIATDKLIDQRPEYQGVRPRGWPAGTWDNSDGTYDKPTNQVIAGDLRLEGNKWQHSPRVESVVRHETGHAIDHNMGDFSHYDPRFVSAYTREKSMLPAPAKQNLWYMLQKGSSGREEAFAEAFAALYGGAAQGQQSQHLMETYFHDTLEVVKNTMNSLN